MPWPLTTERLDDGQLAIGGIGLSLLAERYGTPLYLFDEETLRFRARMFRRGFADVYPRSRVTYAGKAGLSPAVVAILRAEGLGLDVVSGGELYAGLAAGVPASAMTFHGNNKSRDELREAISCGIGLIAIDNDWEIELLAELTESLRRPIRVLLRLNPAVEVDTHEKMQTGVLDSKFGFPIMDDIALDAADRVVVMPSLNLVGYHTHVGSQLTDTSLVGRSIAEMLAFSAVMRDRHRIVPDVISPGGGFGVADDASTDVEVAPWASEAATAMRSGCEQYSLPLPELVVEPGRALVGPAGVALYRAGARKAVPGGRTFVSVDGGMADNIRPSLYGAAYSAKIANRSAGGPVERIALAGKYCESGDILLHDVELPMIEGGDLIAIPMVGAYCLPMASNYNMAPRPAVVMVRQGTSRITRRRETYASLLVDEVFSSEREFE